MTIGAVKKNQENGANILAIKKREENRIIPSPDNKVSINQGDLLIILGTKVQLKKLESLV